MNCRFCGKELKHTFIDLGMSPLSNSFLPKSKLDDKENFYPLHVYVCEDCYLVQLNEFQSPIEIFEDYAYFSSYSSSWLEHAKKYVDDMIKQEYVNKNSYVIEIASNDGYLLKNFKDKNIKILGVEPAKNVAAKAIEAGVPTISEFFGVKSAEKLAQQQKPDLIVANNVLAHVPDINDFVQGFSKLLSDEGVITFEFPHLLKLMQYNQFDTIYHEHFSYLSLTAVAKIFDKHNLKIFAVDELKTHGGSLRLYVTHEFNQKYKINPSVNKVLNDENEYGINTVECYKNYNKQVEKVKFDLLSTLINLKRNNKKVIAYGAAAKGNTLLNYCGIREEFIDYIVDKNPAKQNLFAPGTHIPVYSPDIIRKTKPDYILILPWNLRDEIIAQNAFINEWGGKFIVPIPNVEVV